MLINIDDCKGLSMKLCQLAEEKQLTDEQFRYFTKGWQALWGMIIELPSADRPQGKWIITEQDNGHKWTHRKCSECGKGIIEPLGVSAMKFCPNCGADMRKGTDDE